MSSAEVAKKSGQRSDVLCPKFGLRAPENFWGICKLTPLPTYRPSLVEIPWLVFHLNNITYSFNSQTAIALHGVKTQR